MKQAVILAAGEGQRLRPFTVTKPKVMLSIAGKPIIQYVVEALAQNGIRNIVVVVGYRKEQVFDYLRDGQELGVEIDYVTQQRQLGTAHALAQVVEKADDEFMVLGGDNLIRPETIARFAAIRPNSVLIKKVADTTRYGVVAVEDGAVKGVVEKPKEPKSNLINTGIYAFSREIFDYIGDELDIPDVLNNMVNQGVCVNAIETTGTWLDVAYPWDIIGLTDAVLSQLPANTGGTIESGATVKGQVTVKEGAVIRAGSYIVGPVVIGKNCDIGPNVCIYPSTSIGDNVVVAPFSEISNSVIADDVHIGTGSVIHDSVIDKGCIIRGHFTAFSGEADIKINEEHLSANVGAMLGAGCNLWNNVIAQPGVIVGNYSQIQVGKSISGRLPDRSFVC